MSEGAIPPRDSEPPASESKQLVELALLAEEMAGVVPRTGDPARVRLEKALGQIQAERTEASNETRRMEQELHRSETTLRALRASSQISSNVASAFQREKVLAAIPDALVRTFGAATARVWLLGPGDRCGTCAQASRCSDRTRCLHLVESGARGPLDLALARVPIGNYSVGRVVFLGKAVSSNNLEAEPGLADPDWARLERIRSFAGHPLIHEGKLLGAVALWSRAVLREDLLEPLKLLAQHASTAIAGAELIEAVRAESARRHEAAARLSAMLNTGRNGAVLFNNENRAVYVNSAFRQLFNIDGRPLVDLSRDQIEALLETRILRRSGDAARGRLLIAPDEMASGAGSFTRSELFTNAEPDGVRIIELYSGVVRSEDGEPHGWMAAFTDVSGAREVDRLKADFISTVSHELRTPLTSIKGALALVLDGAAPLDPESQDLLRISERNADRLVRLVSDILDISRAEADKLELRLTNLSAATLCAQTAEEMVSIAAPMRVTLLIEADESLPRVRADADRVLQVLSNLLSNALKFSPPGAVVNLRAVLSPEPGFIRFEVKDRGPGVALEFRRKLFTRFAQSERTEREQRGTGLGLAICQALVQKLGGEIGCDSVPGQGATFFFTLPLADQKESEGS